MGLNPIRHAKRNHLVHGSRVYYPRNKLQIETVHKMGAQTSSFSSTSFGIDQDMCRSHQPKFAIPCAHLVDLGVQLPDLPSLAKACC
jgi:hypothetical protein